ncbi:hypothetical protein ACLMJK_004222 [Lecanora helva]
MVNSYAIIGATGKTGNALFTHLQKNPQNRVNTYVRSKPKLLSQFPNVDKNSSVQIFPGAINDIPLIASCIRDVDVIFSVLGENENTPGLRIAQDSAQAIVAALCHLGCTKGSTNKVPKIIMLSSATVNPRMTADQPAFLTKLLHTALSNAYADIERAEEYLRLHESWVKVTFIQPGGLAEDERQKGHKLSLDRKGAPPFVTYVDLAAGMIEVAEAGEFDWMGVSVVSASHDVKFGWKAPKQIARGLVWHYAPSFAWMAKFVGLF